MKVATGLSYYLDQYCDRKAQVLDASERRKSADLAKKGKMTVRRRIHYIIDEGEDFLEIGTFAGENMYAEEGGCPSGGVVTGISRVAGKKCIIIANDPAVKSGAFFPITTKKVLRAQEISMQNNLPIIYLVDSAGINLGRQADVFPDKNDFGKIFRNNAIISARGIVQLAGILGSCVAGGAYLPAMCDEAFIVEGAGTIFLASSFLVNAAIGEKIDNQALGGALTQCDVSGVIDNRYPDEQSCLDAMRRAMGRTHQGYATCFSRVQPEPPALKIEELEEMLPENRNQSYDMREIIRRLTDGSEFHEYKKNFGKTILCGYAVIDGWHVGIVANQRVLVKNSKAEHQIGGVIYSDSADKAARFIMNCNQKKIPLVFLQDVSGFMVGSKAEQGGIIKDGAKMLYALANSIVPKIVVIVGNSFGAGNYAMCGRAFDPRFMFAWPTARIGVMSGASAAKTMLQVQAGALQAAGKEMSAEDKIRFSEKIMQEYEESTNPYYAAARLWVDEIIHPFHTRAIISNCIETASYAALQPSFNVGMIQT